MYTLFLIALIGAFLGQQIIFTMLVALKTSKDSKYRKLGAIALVCISVYQSYLQEYLFSSLLSHFLSMCAVPLTCLKLVHYLLFTQAVDAAVPANLSNLPWSAWRRSFVQVLRDIRGVRQRTEKYATDANFNKFQALRNIAARYVRDVVVAELLWFVGRHIYVPNTIDWELCFGPGKEFLLLRATNQQLLARAYSSISLWIGLYFVIDTFDCLIQFASVVLGDRRPQDWPPLFGNLKEAFSLRRFWG